MDTISLEDGFGQKIGSRSMQPAKTLASKFGSRQSIPSSRFLPPFSQQKQSSPRLSLPHHLNHSESQVGLVDHLSPVYSSIEDLYNVDYNEAVKQLGVGRFHWAVALTCGLMFLSAGLQNNLNAYILSSVHCDLHIDSTQMGLLNVAFLTGGIASSFLWGVIADMMGLRTVLMYGMFLDGLLSLCSSLSQHYVVLLTFRFLNAFIVGGPSSLVFAYMGEFFPDNVRAKVICYVGISWTLSWVIMPGLAWLIIPLQWSVTMGGFVYNSWRLLIAVTAVPSLLSAAFLLMFPESPRFLLVKNKGLEAINTLAKIYAVNNNSSPIHYPVRSLQEPSSCGITDSNPKSVCRPVTIFIKQAQLLFAPETIKITALSSAFFFTNIFGYYGLGLWLPELFNRMSSQQLLFPEAELTLCSTSLTASVNTSLSDHTFVECDPTDIDTSIFTNSLIMGVVGLSGNLASGVLAGRLQRKTLPVLLMGSSALCIFVIYFTTSLTLNWIMATLFQLTVGTANQVFNSLVVDMFPPNISGMGVCVAILSGRVGGMISNIVLGELVDKACSVPIFLAAGILMGGSVISWFIPNKPFSDSSQSAPNHKMDHEISVIT